MNSYQTYVLGEDIRNLDLCYTGDNAHLYKVRRDSDLNRNLAIVINVVTYEEFVENKGYEDIPLLKGSHVRGLQIIATPKVKLI